MLVLDNKKISRREVASMFGVDLKKIEKQPSFEIDKSKISKDKANGNVVKVNAGTSMRSRFYFEHPESGVTTELRYAKAENSQVVGEKVVNKFTPHYVRYFKETQDGSTNSNIKFSFQDDLDLALYFYLHPQNKFSPLRKKNNKMKIGYEFIDSKARAIDKMTNLNKTAEAMENARNIDEFNMTILAKGLGFKSVDKKDSETLRAEMLEFAMTKPSTYLDSVKTRVVFTEGLIVNLIDKGVLSLDKIHGVRQWVWKSGEREGEVVGQQIINQTQDAKAYIKTFILNNLQTYHSLLNSVTDNLKSKEKASEFFVKQEKNEVDTIGENLPDHLREFNQPTVNSGTPLPSNFQEARDYVATKGYPKLPAKVKVFNDAIQDGSVTYENANAFLRELFKED